MSIRRRLFFSNMLMLVVPILLSALLCYLILFSFTSRSDEPLYRVFPMAFRVGALAEGGGDLDELIQEAKTFNAGVEDKNVFIAVVGGNEFLFPEEARERLAGYESLYSIMLEGGVIGNISRDNLHMITMQAGEYRLLLCDLRSAKAIPARPITFQVVLVLGGLIAVVLLTNRILTHLLTRSITGPLGMLVDGVHQLRDGNLSYRIQYKRRDEFAPVCGDFNDMAEYLQQMIDRQQRDEQSRKELLAGISHDLRTPLTSIKAYVEGLLDGIAEDLPTQLKYLGTIRQKAEDIDRLVDKLFLFSKLEMDEYPFHLERLNLAEELGQLVTAGAEEYAGRGLVLQRGSLPDSAWVRTDPVQLHSALVNILENSAQYKEKPLGVVRIDCAADGDSFSVTLTDDGPGVPQESLAALFDVFYRSDPSRQNPNKGSGLGLAITKRIVERMGGTIRAENAREGGLRVILTLPGASRGEAGE